MDICNIVYFKDNKKFEFQCSAYSANTIISDLKKQGAKIQEITTQKRLKTSRKELTENEIEIRKYYRYRYITYYRLFKSGNISQEIFNEIKEFLKSQKSICKTKEQFEINFKEYIKALNI